MSTPNASTGGGEKPQVGEVQRGAGRPGGPQNSATGTQADAAQIRASDAERETALRTLADHYADGRLDRAEFDERAEAAFAARTRDQLRTLFRDLPRPAAELVRRRGGGWPASSPDRSDRSDRSDLVDRSDRSDLLDLADRPDLADLVDARGQAQAWHASAADPAPARHVDRPGSTPSPSRPYVRPFGPLRVAGPLVLLVPVLLALAVAAALHGVPPFPLIPLFFLLTRILLIPTRRPRRWHREARPWI